METSNPGDKTDELHVSLAVNLDDSDEECCQEVDRTRFNEWTNEDFIDKILQLEKTIEDNDDSHRDQTTRLKSKIGVLEEELQSLESAIDGEYVNDIGEIQDNSMAIRRVFPETQIRHADGSVHTKLL